MNRPNGVTVAAALTFSGAMVLALGSFSCFLVGVLTATGDERGDPVSVAITGMAIAGGLLLLILAAVAAWVAMNAGELREWARTVSLQAMAASVEARWRGVLMAARRSWLVEFISSHVNRGLEHHS
jgi:hypothetical protein